MNSQLDLSLANEPIARLETYQQAVHVDRVKSKRRKTFLKLFVLSIKIVQLGTPRSSTSFFWVNTRDETVPSLTRNVL